VCVVAYVAGVVVLAGATPVVYTAAVTIGSWVPAGDHIVLDSQSASDDRVSTTSVDDDIRPAMNSINQEPSSTPPQSFVIHLFHILTFTDTVMLSTSFPAFHKSSVSDPTCSRNCSTCSHFPSTDQNRSADKNFAATQKGVYGRQRLMAKRTKNASCRQHASPNQRAIFSHLLSSVEKPSPTSEASIPRGIISPLSDSQNASLVFNMRTLLELV